MAGPKRPQDRIELPKLKESFIATFSKPVTENGFGKAGGIGQNFLVSGNGQSADGGGSQEPVSAQKARSQNTNPQTETEMANNHPTPDPRRGAGPGVEK